jgi:hypothetical protein
MERVFAEKSLGPFRVDSHQPRNQLYKRQARAFEPM